MTILNSDPSTPPRAVTVRLFGSLRAIGLANGHAATFEYEVAECGAPACDIATDLGLPLSRIEGVFINHRAHGVNHVVAPGDRIAFVAPEVPGPHRYSLGLYDAGKNPDS